MNRLIELTDYMIINEIGINSNESIAWTTLINPILVAMDRPTLDVSMNIEVFVEKENKDDILKILYTSTDGRCIVCNTTCIPMQILSSQTPIRDAQILKLESDYASKSKRIKDLEDQIVILNKEQNEITDSLQLLNDDGYKIRIVETSFYKETVVIHFSYNYMTPLYKNIARLNGKIVLLNSILLQGVETIEGAIASLTPNDGKLSRELIKIIDLDSLKRDLKNYLKKGDLELECGSAFSKIDD